MSFFHAMLSAGGFINTIGKIWVNYNASDFSYLASKAGYADTGSFNSGSNVIGIATMTTTGQDNHSLSYDAVNDRIVSSLDTTLKFIKRDDYVTAAAAAAGTIPTFDASVTVSQIHGHSIDPINSYVYQSGGGAATTATIRDFSNNVIETITLPGSIKFSMIHYDFKEQILYGGDSASSTTIYGIKKISGVWTIVYTSTFFMADGISRDYISDKLAGHSTIGGLLRIRNQDLAGPNVTVSPTPLNPLTYNGFLCDPIDGTYWTNENGATYQRLWHYDPLKRYRKTYRWPHMCNYSNVMTDGDVLENYYEQQIYGNGWSIFPVIDWAAHTGQQSAANWGSEFSVEIQYRGSGTAPTTAADSAKDYHTVIQYAKPTSGNSEGWGSTTPSAWQSTPTTDRYMQVRVRPITNVPASEPTALTVLGAENVIAWYTSQASYSPLFNELIGCHYDWFQSNRVALAMNVANPSQTTNFENGTATQRPQWVSGYWDMEAGTRHFTSVGTGAGIDDLIKTLGSCEVHIVYKKVADSSAGAMFALGQASTNNNQYRFQHKASTDTPANLLGIRMVDNAGNVVEHGVVDTNGDTARLVSFRIGDGVANKIWINNVEQTVTDYTGTNTGQGFTYTTAANVDRTGIGRQLASTGVAFVGRIWEVGVTQVLTTQKKTDLYNHFVSRGII